MFYRARWYDAQQGRFLSEDPIRISSRRANLYEMANDDPVNFVDHEGLQATTAGCGCSEQEIQRVVQAATTNLGATFNYIYDLGNKAEFQRPVDHLAIGGTRLIRVLVKGGTAAVKIATLGEALGTAGLAIVIDYGIQYGFELYDEQNAYGYLAEVAASLKRLYERCGIPVWDIYFGNVLKEHIDVYRVWRDDDPKHFGWFSQKIASDR